MIVVDEVCCGSFVGDTPVGVEESPLMGCVCGTCHVTGSSMCSDYY